jgi:hypothetical protein
VLGVPAFDEIRIQTGKKAKPFIIKSFEKTSAGTPEHYRLNGAAIPGYAIKHSQIVAGGELMVME